MLRSHRRIVQSAGNGVYRSRLAFVVLQHDTFKSVHNTFFPVLHGCGVVSHAGASSERFHTDNVHRFIHEGNEHADGVAAAAYACADYIGKQAGHLFKLVFCLLAYDVLEIPDHEREGMGAHCGTDTVDGVLIVLSIGFKSGIHGLFQGLVAVCAGNHLGAQDLHTCHIGSLFGNIHLTHVHFTL